MTSRLMDWEGRIHVTINFILSIIIEAKFGVTKGHVIFIHFVQPYPIAIVELTLH